MSKYRGIMPLFLAYMIWGLLPVYWKLLVAVPSDRIIAHRILWSLVFVTLVLVAKRRLSSVAAILRQPRQLGMLALAAVLVTTNWFIYIYAVNSNQIVASSLGYYINPLVSIALGALVYRERFKPVQLAAIGLAAAGVAVIAIDAGRLPWISLALAFSFGIYGLLKKMVAVASAEGLAMETALIAPLALLYLVLAPAGGLLGGDPAAAARAAGAPAAGSLLLLILLPLTGVMTATPLLLFATGTRHLDLSMVGFMQYIAPSIMLLLGIFAYGEPFTSVHAVCFGLIWTGLFLYTASKMGLWQSLSRLTGRRKPAEQENGAAVPPAEHLT